ncbi:MAG: hypothetical protein LDL41_00530 [Coleofasciculus sp. S288]|nr:hypothetical protein [Coleofasciculus sp. S288]
MCDRFIHLFRIERSLPSFTCKCEDLRGAGEGLIAALNKSANLSNCPSKAQVSTTLNPGF